MRTMKVIPYRAIALVVLSLAFAFPSPARGEKEVAMYDLPAVMSHAHIRALKKAGWSDEKMGRLFSVYRTYHRTYAFIRLPKPVPATHLLLLAEWASVITGNKIDPYLTAGIHKHEVYHDVDIGKCSFYGVESTRIGGHTEKDREKEAGRKKLLAQEKKAHEANQFH